MNRVRVDVPDVHGSTLVGEVTATGRPRRFFSGKPFRATYSEDIESVPEHLRPIPVLAQVAPVAWATGAEVSVETADAAFLDGLRRIRSTLMDLYPEFMRGGAIDCPEPVDAEHDPGEFDDAGMLFTGGVDSTATYIRHRDEDPALVSVRGWVIGLDEDDRWDRTREYVNSFARERGQETAFIESNMLDFLATPLLQAHFQRYLDGAWYSSVGHGLGLLGLCAPLASARNWGSLYMGATHTSEWTRPWGSRPDIDDHVEWSGTECFHDGYDLSRQGKIDLIASYVENESGELPLRTCSYVQDAGNCSDCEKCYRTIVGLLLAGLDPNDHGYDYGPSTLPTVRERFESGAWYLSPQKQYHWEVLQEAARERSMSEHPESQEFFDWFESQDLCTYVEASERSLRHRTLQMLARKTPTSIYSTLYPLYRRAASAGH